MNKRSWGCSWRKSLISWLRSWGKWAPRDLIRSYQRLWVTANKDSSHNSGPAIIHKDHHSGNNNNSLNSTTKRFPVLSLTMWTKYNLSTRRTTKTKTTKVSTITCHISPMLRDLLINKKRLLNSRLLSCKTKIAESKKCLEGNKVHQETNWSLSWELSWEHWLKR